MPFGDRTGPWGHGPMTGRAAGYCAGYSVPGYMNPVAGRGGWGRGGGRGFGWGRGGGRGFGGGRGWGGGRGFGWGAPAWGAPAYGDVPYGTPYGAPYAPTYSSEQELTALKDDAKYFEDALTEIRKRMEELETSAEDK
jgi:hypothetical protein